MTTTIVGEDEGHGGLRAEIEELKARISKLENDKTALKPLDQEEAGLVYKPIHQIEELIIKGSIDVAP